jgi:hypothetical protein
MSRNGRSCQHLDAACRGRETGKRQGKWNRGAHLLHLGPVWGKMGVTGALSYWMGTKQAKLGWQAAAGQLTCSEPWRCSWKWWEWGGCQHWDAGWKVGLTL